MKVGIYDPYLDDTGGGEKYMLTIAQVLAERHKVSVFWDRPEDLERAQQRFGLSLEQVKTAKNIFSPHVSFFERLVKSRKYDAIVYLSDGSIPLLFSKLFVHVQQPLKEFQSTSLKDKLKLKRVACFFCNSAFTKQYIEGRFDLKTVILYPPVEIHAQKIKKENIILHVGRFRRMGEESNASDYKKQYIMLETFKDLVDRGLKKWKFVLAVGVQDKDADAFQKLKDRYKKYPITFEINKNNDELWSLYSKAKIYWHATGYGEDVAKHPELAEHFGISTVEAMGAGAVPVVYSAGGQKEIVSDGINGLLWSDTRELKEVTLILINSKAMLEDLSLEAKKRAKDFNMEMFRKHVLEMMQTK